ncbi:MAG: prepilin-type N-terminal cleavage/methylation domain-containing protein [Gammaproteobacteria bacterium]|nr:prepilin-type N-terminal cleavage/methylation domain-containing protein [Gammaproteobacteria bacterium]
MQKVKGFTLVEISIVLVIVGLILGGVLKGQALIDSARVRSIVNDINGIRAAWYGFQDRFHALPGDYKSASSHIGATMKDGNGDGSIDTKQEIASVWQHLAATGFIAGDFDGDSAAVGALEDAECASTTCPQNPFYGFYKITYTGKGEGVSGDSNEFYTGGKIPSSLLFEIDTKLDDGLPDQGLFRVHADSTANCTDTGHWKVDEPYRDCAAVFIE